MLKFKFNKKVIKTTPLMDKIILFLGGGVAVLAVEWIVKLQENINIFIR